jgi:hypothetical protein
MKYETVIKVKVQFEAGDIEQAELRATRIKQEIENVADSLPKGELLNAHVEETIKI